MEPFGLFDLLKMLSPKADEQPPAAAENPTENNISPPATALQQEEPPSTANACVEFLSRHEQRAKRTKR